MSGQSRIPVSVNHGLGMAHDGLENLGRLLTRDGAAGSWEGGPAELAVTIGFLARIANQLARITNYTSARAQHLVFQPGVYPAGGAESLVTVISRLDLATSALASIGEDFDDVHRTAATVEQIVPDA